MINKRFVKQLIEEDAVDVYRLDKKVKNIQVDSEDYENETTINLWYDDIDNEFFSSITYKDLKDYNQYNIVFKQFNLFDIIQVANFGKNIPIMRWLEIVNIMKSNILNCSNYKYLNNKKARCVSLVRNKNFYNEKKYCLMGTPLYGNKNQFQDDLGQLFHDIVKRNNLEKNKNKTF